ncbi:MAG: SMP-30/gluconolactonase/LRE family protein [Alphaproteobacteria bacterium]|nr:SMP-30/gluconolactonase/LRE family protein [Alphaproteobacteria bacterium]
MIKTTATLFTQLPDELHFKGEPNDWVKMTRPGQRLHSFLEGPEFDDDGNLYIVDVPYGRIFKITPTGEWQLFYQYEGEPHSIKIDKNGDFIFVDYKLGLVKYAPKQNKLTTIATAYNGMPFKGLSDLTIAVNGDYYFTDSGRTSLSDPTGCVYKYNDLDGLTLILDNVPYPNGIVTSTDGQTCFVAATRANAVWKFKTNKPEPIYPMVGNYIQLTGGLGPDGLAVNKDNKLAVAHAQMGRVYVYSLLGDLLLEIPLPQGLWVTSVAFHPKNQNELYIIEAQYGAIYRIYISANEG